MMDDDSKSRKDLMFEAEMTNQQLERLQEYMERIDKQMFEVKQLKDALDSWKDIEEDEEMLVPLASGIFVKAKSTGEKTLMVNSGSNVVVSKSIDDVHKMLDNQLVDMQRYSAELNGEYDKQLSKMKEMEREFEKLASKNPARK